MRFKLPTHFRMVFVMNLFILGCSHTPRNQVVLNTDRLLSEDLMQGWQAVEKAPPIVGEFDVVYSSLPKSSVLDTPIELDQCAFADSPERTIIICEKQEAAKKPKSTRYQSI